MEELWICRTIFTTPTKSESSNTTVDDHKLPYRHAYTQQKEMQTLSLSKNLGIESDTVPVSMMIIRSSS
jgi:hypothetical protein